MSALVLAGAPPLGSVAPHLSRSSMPIAPAIIVDLGDSAIWRYVEFFTANIRDPNTRRTYTRACGRFFG